MFAEIRLQSTCRRKMFVEFDYVSFHGVFFFMNLPAVVYGVCLKTRILQQILWFVFFKVSDSCIVFFFPLSLSLLEKKGRKVRQSTEMKQSVNTENLLNINNKLY